MLFVLRLVWTRWVGALLAIGIPAYWIRDTSPFLCGCVQWHVAHLPASQSFLSSVGARQLEYAGNLETNLQVRTNMAQSCNTWDQ